MENFYHQAMSADSRECCEWRRRSMESSARMQGFLDDAATRHAALLADYRRVRAMLETARTRLKSKGLHIGQILRTLDVCPER